MSDTKFIDASGSTQGTLVTASWLNDVNTKTYDLLLSVAGTNTIIATGPQGLVSYTTGTDLNFIPVNGNTGPVTLNVSGLGAKAVTKYGATPLVSGDLAAGSLAQLTYDGTQFQLLNPQTPSVLETGRLLNTQTFLASGTYIPTPGTTRIIVEAWGAGGQGGGVNSAPAGQVQVGSGGGSGGYSKALLTSGFSSAVVTIGVGGSAAGSGTGQGGTATTFGGTLVVANGGAGGASGVAGTTSVALGGVGAAAGTGNIIASPGAQGITACSAASFNIAVGAVGTASPMMGGIASPTPAGTGSAFTGLSAAAYVGAGGAGASLFATTVSLGGGVAGSGRLIVYEYS